MNDRAQHPTDAASVKLDAQTVIITGVRETVIPVVTPTVQNHQEPVHLDVSPQTTIHSH